MILQFPAAVGKIGAHRKSNNTIKKRCGVASTIIRTASSRIKKDGLLINNQPKTKLCSANDD
jgi:hypothetical protein